MAARVFTCRYILAQFTLLHIFDMLAPCVGVWVRKFEQDGLLRESPYFLFKLCMKEISWVVAIIMGVTNLM